MAFARVPVFCLLLLLETTHVLGHDKKEWQGRVIYQLLTDRFARDDGLSPDCDVSNYCGGTYKGVTNHLDYIQGMGFDAIWISPVVKNREGGYHGYWTMDWDSLNEHFGTADDLKEMVRECHKRGIWVMVDVVANHAGILDDSFDTVMPYNKSDYYHPDCQITDWNDQHQVEVCRLAGLADLDQSNSFVHKTMVEWIGSLIKTFDFDGVRIDTFREVPKDFWTEFTNNAGVYSTGEIYDGRIDLVAGYQPYCDGPLNYPLYFTSRDCYANKGSMNNMQSTLKSEVASFQNMSYLATFSDNHDQPRFLHMNSDWTLLDNYLTFNTFVQGIPIIYYGTEQGYTGGNDPNNREALWPNYDTSHDLYKFITKMVSAYKKYRPWEHDQVQRYADDQFYAFTRGPLFVATSNIGSGQSLERTITYDSYKEGTKLCNVFDLTKCTTVSGGKFTLQIENGEPMLMYPQ